MLGHHFYDAMLLLSISAQGWELELTQNCFPIPSSVAVSRDAQRYFRTDTGS